MRGGEALADRTDASVARSSADSDRRLKAIAVVGRLA
jgi:hypothetical protein